MEVKIEQILGTGLPNCSKLQIKDRLSKMNPLASKIPTKQVIEETKEDPKGVNMTESSSEMATSVMSSSVAYTETSKMTKSTAKKNEQEGEDSESELSTMDTLTAKNKQFEELYDKMLSKLYKKNCEKSSNTLNLLKDIRNTSDSHFRKNLPKGEQEDVDNFFVFVICKLISSEFLKGEAISAIRNLSLSKNNLSAEEIMTFCECELQVKEEAVKLATKGSKIKDKGQQNKKHPDVVSGLISMYIEHLIQSPESQEEKKMDGNKLISKIREHFKKLKKAKTLSSQQKRMVTGHTTLPQTVVDMLKRAKVLYSVKGNLLMLDKAQLDLVYQEIGEQGKEKYFAAWLQE